MLIKLYKIRFFSKSINGIAQNMSKVKIAGGSQR